LDVETAFPASCRAADYTWDVNGLQIELNIALLPTPNLAGRLIAASAEFASRYRAIIRLGDGNRRLSHAPHITLYQVPVPLADLPALHEGLRKVAHAQCPLRLACTGLAYNSGEASLEARREAPDALVALQGAVLDLASPLRCGLLERDPAGNPVASLLEAPGLLGDNIRRTGYAEVGDPRAGGLFRPHDTLNWLEPGTAVDVAREERDLDVAGLTGEYTALGMFTLGPYGTCPQLLARYELGRAGDAFGAGGPSGS
jgi:hypothetical protein